MRTITLEEHYASPGYLDGPGKDLRDRVSGTGATGLLERLSDLDDARIAEMDAAGIDVQVLSLTAPGVEQLDPDEAVAFAREANNVLVSAVRRHPTRFAGLAALPTPAPTDAAAELERTVRDLGFKGALINGHSRGRYLDDPFFSPILERAEALQVPIYLHPTAPPAPVIAASYAGFDPRLTYILANAGWGWHIETAVHVLRMVVGGVFDRYPRLQLVIGHLGEALPFMLPRIERNFSAGRPGSLHTDVAKLERPIGAYFRENLHYTISGFNFLPPFLDLLLQVGVDRIMFSADYPYASMAEARAFLDAIPVSPADRERIAHRNAERLFGL